MTRTLLPAIAALAALLLAPAAQAQQAVLTITGTLLLVSDPAVNLDATAAAGTPYTFTYLFDYVAPDARDSDSNANVYYFTRLGTGATVTFGNYTLTPGRSVNEAYVGGDPSRYGIGFSTGGETVTRLGAPVLGGVAADIQLLEMDGHTLPGNALPSPSGFTLSDFKPYSDGAFGSYLSITASLGPNDGDTFIKGSIDTLSVQALAPVPEPSAFVALAIGILGLGALTARKRFVGSVCAILEL